MKSLHSQLSYSDSELDRLELAQHSSFFRNSTRCLSASPSPPLTGGSPLPQAHEIQQPLVGRTVTFTGAPDRLGLHCLGPEDDNNSGSQYVNKDSLAHDLSFLATMPELCDVTFIVGSDRQPICAVGAILAARSW